MNLRSQSTFMFTDHPSLRNNAQVSQQELSVNKICSLRTFTASPWSASTLRPARHALLWKRGSTERRRLLLMGVRAKPTRHFWIEDELRRAQRGLWTGQYVPDGRSRQGLLTPQEVDAAISELGHPEATTLERPATTLPHRSK